MSVSVYVQWLTRVVKTEEVLVFIYLIDNSLMK